MSDEPARKDSAEFPEPPIRFVQEPDAHLLPMDGSNAEPLAIQSWKVHPDDVAVMDEHLDAVLQRAGLPSLADLRSDLDG